MATSRQFAYNNSDLIPGTIQVGNLSVGVPTSGFTSSPQFWSGPDEELGYVIASPTSGNTQPTPIFIEAPSGQMNCSTIYKGTDIQLSNNNQTAYQAFGYQMSVLTNTFIDKNDRVMFSVLSTTLQPLTLPQSRFVGVGKTTMNYQGDPYGGYPGNDTQSIGINAIGEYYYNGSVVQSGLPTWASGDIVDIAISHGQWWWIRVNGGDWNNNPVANPETNTSGLLMNGLVNCYPVLCPGYEGTMTIQNTATYGTPVGFTLFGVNENASVYFNRTKTLTEEAFIDLSEYVSNKNGTPQTFTTGNQASAWLTNNGFWNSWVGVSNNIIIEGVYYPGSVNASYTATASYPLDVDMKVNFQNTLGTISGSPLVLSGSVEILAGSTTGYEQLTVDYNYNNLTDESSFGNVSFDITGTTEYGFTVEASSGTTFDVTPTPTPSVTPPVTPSVTTTNTPTLPTPGSILFSDGGNYGVIPTITPVIAPGSNTFTVEGWINMTQNPSVGYGGYIPSLIGDGGINGGLNWGFGPSYDRKITLYCFNDDPGQFSVYGNTVMDLNKWYHVAVSVNSGVPSLFVDGVLQTNNFTTDKTTFQIQGSLYGLILGQFPNDYFYGYASNLRITDNQALYTESFTPSTSSLTTTSQGAVSSNVNLLLNTFYGADYLVDSSHNNYTVNISGLVQSYEFNPFTSIPNPYVHYDATVASSLTVVGSNVTQWNDISGNGYNLTIGAGTGPTISAIGPNQALFFNTTKLIRNLVPLTTEVTVLMSLIYSPSGSIGSWGNFMHHGDHDYDWSIRRNYNSNFIQMHTDNNNDSALNVPVSNNNIYVMVGRITQSGGSTNLVESWLYNKTGASNSTSNTIPKSIVAGNKTLYVGGSDVNEYSNSVIGEIMYYNSSLSNSDLQTAVTYMKDKWFATAPTPTPTPTVTQTPTVTVTPTNTVTPTKTSVTPTPTSTPGTGPTPVLDLDAANYSALPVNGSTVAGTGGYTVTMTNANSSMSWNSSNGGVFRKSTGNGTDQLIVSGINYSSGTQPYTVFMAYKASPTVPGRILGANSANPDWNLGTYYAYKNEYYPGGPVNFMSDATDTAWNFIWGIGNGTNLSQLYIATSTAPTAVYKTANFVGGFNGLRLFGRYQNATTSNELQTGDIGFVKVYNSVLTLSQIQTLHSTYKTRFGY
jgi:hypothetical protein